MFFFKINTNNIFTINFGMKYLIEPSTLYKWKILGLTIAWFVGENKGNLNENLFYVDINLERK